MARERADSFISRFLFRSSKEREQEAVGADVEPTSESAAEHELVWATNGEQSVQKLVERTITMIALCGISIVSDLPNG